MDKNTLLMLINNLHSNYGDIFEEPNQDLVIYTDGPWDIRDIIGHTSDFNYFIVDVIDKGSKGEKIQRIPLDPQKMEEASQHRVKVKRSKPTKEVHEEWKQSLKDIEDLVHSIGDKLDHEIDIPTGEKKKIYEAIHMMLEHQKSHFEDIKSVLSDTKET